MSVKAGAAAHEEVEWRLVSYPTSAGRLHRRNGADKRASAMDTRAQNPEHRGPSE
eukprot:CAMPEP_0195140060 /NCGR_PEP_ID=MMETSP0448-20130528/160483_1 /TAXON_ID=66468 /ORGANISM="Heterocapsa triquestra, Strain CCMP 448" /LENGTH=54 /DNA_ID=CAMNT_0040178383 /DNA_START=48 /DNA_END=209 /DNA_ORIENTATION=+